TPIVRISMNPNPSLAAAVRQCGAERMKSGGRGQGYRVDRARPDPERLQARGRSCRPGSAPSRPESGRSGSESGNPGRNRGDPDLGADGSDPDRAHPAPGANDPDRNPATAAEIAVIWIPERMIRISVRMKQT